MRDKYGLATYTEYKTDFRKRDLIFRSDLIQDLDFLESNKGRVLLDQ